jgi:ATP-binding cassette, subfamily F, member 3
MLRIDSLTYRVGARVLLDGAQASIDPGHRVGLVGRNGTGKTTLLKIIAGALEPHGGRVIVPSRWRVGMTAQEAPGGSASLVETVLAADTDLASLSAEAETATDPHRIAEIHARLHEKRAHAAPARAARILAGLGFNEAAQQRPCSEYSGGWRMRVSLAGLLFCEPDLLLLDEPTNHLDLEATLWLEDWLRTYPGTLLLVSHDRGLLNRVPQEILHLEGATLTLYSGGYDRFEQAHRARLEQQGKLREKQTVQRTHLQAFVDRFRYKASKAKQAQSRLKMLSRLEPIPEVRDEPPIRFRFPDPEPLSPPLLSLDRIAVGYDGQPVLKNIGLRLDADDRVALLGANGNGKSTLIKLLARRLEPLSGEVARSGKLKIGYFAQHQAEELDAEATPLVELARRRPRDPEELLRAQLGRFGFTQERAETRIAGLSGGEKARLLFALITCERPHILLLDEPTNHLDVLSREALVQALAEFQGAVVIVSHDPHVLGLVADRFWLVDQGRVVSFDGDLDDYRARLTASRPRGDSTAGRESASGDPQETGRIVNRKDQRRLATERREALAPLRKRLHAAEHAVERLEAERTTLLAALADPSLYSGETARVAELHKRLGQVERDLGAAEDAWAELQEAWDQAQAPSG